MGALPPNRQSQTAMFLVKYLHVLLVCQRKGILGSASSAFSRTISTSRLGFLDFSGSRSLVIGSWSISSALFGGTSTLATLTSAFRGLPSRLLWRYGLRGPE